MTLDTLGWTPFFADAFNQLNLEGTIAARVFRQDKQSYLVVNERGEYTATLLGRLLYAEDVDLPTVGDWVAIEPFDGEQAVVHDLLPRFSEFARKEVGQKTRRQVVAANVNTVFLVSGLDKDFNLRRIERYLIQTVSSGAKPIIVLNKVDLCDDLQAHIAEVERIATGVDIISLSATEGSGIDQLHALMAPGETVAFIGSSGVGKSSLVNRLVGYEYLKTGAVREDDSRGRHTTSHRELVVLPTGGLVMDTPGMRELQLWGDEDDLNEVFDDINLLSANCRFNDCQHESEPGCAILEAIERGDIDEDRYLSYQKLKREIAFMDRKKGEASIMKSRKHDKSLGKLYKSIQKNNPKRF
ncbi:MAG: ribosome small subunit-dependent GTPase A [Rhodothermales bacterium]